MPHTRSNYNQEQGFTDGIVIVGPEDIMISANGVRTRNAAGDWSINQAASLTGNYAINIGQLLQRTGLPDKFLEQFGGTGPSADAQPQGIYGQNYSGNPVVPRTLNWKKGAKLTGIKAVYQIAGAALTTHTVRVDEVVYANNAALGITAKLANAANGLATAIQANPYATAVTGFVSPGYEVTDLQELIADFTVVTQAAGTYRLYRVELQFEFNFN
jgi:hypothetical protein